jgi:hypothetical protein
MTVITGCSACSDRYYPAAESIFLGGLLDGDYVAFCFCHWRCVPAVWRAEMAEENSN